MSRDADIIALDRLRQSAKVDDRLIFRLAAKAARTGEKPTSKYQAKQLRKPCDTPTESAMQAAWLAALQEKQDTRR